LSPPKQLTIEQALSRAKKATKQGNTSVALQLYNAILQSHPNHHIAKKRLRQLQIKLPHNQSIQTQVANPSQNQIDTLANLYQSGQMAKTESFCRELLQSHPQSLIVINVLGAALKDQGKLKDAIQAFSKVIQLKPDYIEAYYNRGVVLQELGQLSKAVDSYNKAIQLKPDYVQAYNNSGLALQELGQLDKALKSCEQAIQLKPDYAQAYNNRGVVLQELEQLDKALNSYEQAIQLKPDFAEAYNNRGNALKEIGQVDEAIDSYDKAIQFKPDYAVAYSNRNFALNYSSELTQTDIFQKHLEFEKQFGRKILENKLNPLFNKRRNTRLKVGYISADFNNHSVGYFFEPLLKSHDKGSIEIYCYYNNARADDTTKRLMEESEHWRSIVGMNDKDVVNLIRKDSIDILVDLVGHTANNRLTVFTYKPAPIQVTWLGYPNTTGLSAIDYRFTDDVVDPIGRTDDLHSEKLIRLQNGFLCYQGDKLLPPNSALPCLKREHITFGSFNNLSKVTHQVVKIWSKILQSVPNSHLLLKSKQLSDAKTKSRYIEMFKHEGIPENRLELYSWLPGKEEHMELYNSIDIGLDPFPYNGTTTTCEALWMGVPVITMFGNLHAGRVGASIMTHANLENLIAMGTDEYVNMAVKYANNTDYLVKLRNELRSKILRSALCDNNAFAKNIEKAYQEMYGQYLHQN
jgi:predicted O-linked N-acetylglucosamine transferase (SPINDLY family)